MGIDTLKSIQNVTNKLSTPDTVVGSADGVMQQLSNLMPLLNQLGTPGVAYNLYGKDSRAF